MAGSRRHHPGPPPVTAEQRLLHLKDDSWEGFIEDCARQLQSEGEYQQVLRMGGAGDKGRDVCGYASLPAAEDGWDLYQAKFYSSTLSASAFAPDVAKFLWNVHSGGYTRPKNYYICALKVGSSLIDLLLDPEAMRKWILSEWRKCKGKFKQFNRPLTQPLIEFIETFPFGVFKRRTPKELLTIHSRNGAAHWAVFGELGPRDANPDVPEQPDSTELRYVQALLDVYREYTGTAVGTVAEIPDVVSQHFKAQRRLFYTAEGLNRFSRDKLPGAFDELLQDLELAIAFARTAPHPTGFVRLQTVLTLASSLNIGANPLAARLCAGDLPGGCHHLVNRERFNWLMP